MKRNLPVFSVKNITWPTNAALLFFPISKFSSEAHYIQIAPQLYNPGRGVNWFLKLVHIITCQWNMLLVFFQKLFFKFNIFRTPLENWMKYWNDHSEWKMFISISPFLPFKCKIFFPSVKKSTELISMK